MDTCYVKGLEHDDLLLVPDAVTRELEYWKMALEVQYFVDASQTMQSYLRRGRDAVGEDSTDGSEFVHGEE